jgi:ribosomal protein L10
MIDGIVSTYLPQSTKTYTRRFIAQVGEGRLTHLMMDIPAEIELSSLPMMNELQASVEFSLSAKDETLMSRYFTLFIDFLENEKIEYRLL